MDNREADGDPERDLADATAELSETLEALREELTESSTGPAGLPRPPRPSELLRFTEQYTIPTIIALLEAGIKTLELLAAAIRVADGRPIDAAVGADRSQLGAGSRDRLAATSRETLRRLDDALAELQSAASGDPSNPELRRLLDEARELRAEVDERLTDAVERSEPINTGSDSPIEEDSADETETTSIDVDEELASIKRSMDEGGSTDGDDSDDGNSPENPVGRDDG